MMMALIKLNTPSTAIPKILKGMERIQNSGYKTKPSNASGQQSTNRMIQSKKLIIALKYQ